MVVLFWLQPLLLWKKQKLCPQQKDQGCVGLRKWKFSMEKVRLWFLVWRLPCNWHLGESVMPIKPDHGQLYHLTWSLTNYWNTILFLIADYLWQGHSVAHACHFMSVHLHFLSKLSAQLFDPNSLFIPNLMRTHTYRGMHTQSLINDITNNYSHDADILLSTIIYCSTTRCICTCEQSLPTSNMYLTHFYTTCTCTTLQPLR